MSDSPEVTESKVMTSWPHCVFLLTLTPPVLPVSLCRAECLASSTPLHPDNSWHALTKWHFILYGITQGTSLPVPTHSLGLPSDATWTLRL